MQLNRRTSVAQSVNWVALIALAMAALVGPTFAQQGRSQWEYCAIVSVRGGTTSDQRYLGTARIRYFAEPESRDEVIRVQGEQILTGSPVDSESVEAMRLKELNRVITKLGKDGWELIGELPYIRQYQSDLSESKALYFKRPISPRPSSHTARPN